MNIAEFEAKVYAMSEREFVQLQMNLMEAIIEVKVNEGKTVFSEVENGLLN